MPPSTTGGASSIASSSGWSLSMIVPSPVSSFSLAPAGLLRVTVKRSSDSCSLSSTVGTEIVIIVCPAVKVSVPIVAL